MSPVRQNIWFIVVGVVLLAALVGSRVAGDFGRGAAEPTAPSPTEQGSDTADPGADGTSNGGGQTGTDEGVTDGGDDYDFEAVPVALIYQLVDKLRAAGIPPVMPADVAVEYVDGYETIVMSGEFENTSATEARFAWSDGTWYLIEPSGPE